MKNNIFKYLAIIAIIGFFSIKLYSQESISIKLGGYLQSENVLGAVPSSTWNTLVKGNSTDLLDNSNNMSTCFIRSNATETVLSLLDEPLLKSSLVLNNQEFITFLKVPYTSYDVYVYLNPENSEEGTAKVTLNNFSKFVKIGNGAWNGTLEESSATSAIDALKGKNYIVFKGLTGESFTIWAESNIITGPSAIQVVKSTNSSNSEALSSKPTKQQPVKAFLYPNPAKENLFVELNNSYVGKITIKVIDTQGKELHSVFSSKTDNTLVEKINIEQLKSGHYLVIVECDNTKSSIPLVKY